MLIIRMLLWCWLCCAHVIQRIRPTYAPPAFILLCLCTIMLFPIRYLPSAVINIINVICHAPIYCNTLYDRVPRSMLHNIKTRYISLMRIVLVCKFEAVHQERAHTAMERCQSKVHSTLPSPHQFLTLACSHPSITFTYILDKSSTIYFKKIVVIFK